MPSREYLNQRREDRRRELLNLLGGQCERCGSKDRLQFDHKDPSKKSFRIAKQIDAPWDILLEEAKKCRLLCHNCHREKTRENGEHGQPDARHGTLHMYKKYKCRCDECRQAVSKYNSNKRKSLLAAMYYQLFKKEGA